MKGRQTKLIYHKEINQTNVSVLPKLIVKPDIKWPKTAIAVAGDSIMS